MAQFIAQQKAQEAPAPAAAAALAPVPEMATAGAAAAFDAADPATWGDTGRNDACPC